MGATGSLTLHYYVAPCPPKQRGRPRGANVKREPPPCKRCSRDIDDPIHLKPIAGF